MQTSVAAGVRPTTSCCWHMHSLTCMQHTASSSLRHACTISSILHGPPSPPAPYPPLNEALHHLGSVLQQCLLAAGAVHHGATSPPVQLVQRACRGSSGSAGLAGELCHDHVCIRHQCIHMHAGCMQHVHGRDEQAGRRHRATAGAAEQPRLLSKEQSPAAKYCPSEGPSESCCCCCCCCCCCSPLPLPPPTVLAHKGNEVQVHLLLLTGGSGVTH
jgi:hypothetical protein